MERILKRKTKRITRNLEATYFLKKADGEFVISLLEYKINENSECEESVRIRNEKPRRVKKLFRLIVKNNVLQGTLSSVIEDQMC